MFPVLGEVGSLLRPRETVIDNLLCSLYYRATTGLLIACAILLGTKQYFGDPIECGGIDTVGVTQKMFEHYCWVTGTWTIKEYTYDHVRDEVANPGMGQFDKSEGHTKIWHTYYQWVPIVLLLTAAVFYAPRMLWKTLEGGRMGRLCKGLKDRPEGLEHRTKHARKLRAFFRENDNIGYTSKFFFCELLNLVTAVGAWFTMDSFLGGGFKLYGHDFLRYFEPEDFDAVHPHEPRIDPAELIFPKVSSCTFQHHGPDGEIQIKEGLCILPLNILNEKIFYLLWLWFVFLAAASLLFFFYRMTVMCSGLVRKKTLCVSANKLLDEYTQNQFHDLCHCITVGDWFVLRLISKNVNDIVFADLIATLAADKANKDRTVDDDCRARDALKINHNDSSDADVKVTDAAQAQEQTLLKRLLTPPPRQHLESGVRENGGPDSQRVGGGTHLTRPLHPFPHPVKIPTAMSTGAFRAPAATPVEEQQRNAPLPEIWRRSASAGPREHPTIEDFYDAA